MIKKRVLVACGTGVATSVAVAKKLENIFKDRGYGDLVEVSTCTVAEMESKASKYDLIVTTAHNSKPMPVKVIMGVAFLIGRGTEPVLQDILESLGLK
ncbi:MAG: PTS system galactitol-specific IIB component [Erysipelotrichaceae bacterium]|nr:MAG: PTS system galactitol-specific IIB [Erysipelotrichaceae bacterium]TXT18339.1 MAG: PTS system galactitol-specific IIB component [Erysipelotrichaceae bacterium]